jgi:hypothetical protein
VWAAENGWGRVGGLVLWETPGALPVARSSSTPVGTAIPWPYGPLLAVLARGLGQLDHVVRCCRTVVGGV